MSTHIILSLFDYTGNWSRPYREAGFEITCQECIRIIREAKLFIPSKSSCFFCSFQRIAQWEELYRKHPNLYARAVKLEENADRTIRPDGISLQILKNRFDGKSGDLFPDCDFKELTPCLCTL